MADVVDESLYANLMDELRQRVNVIDHVLAERTGLPNVVAYELCLLQLRFICEIMAAACLAAHGDIGGAGLRREWSANTVMKALGALHSDFFPRATAFNVDDTKIRPVGDLHFDGDDGPGGITKEELITLYGTCNDRLHRGSIRKIRASPGNEAPDWKEIDGWLRKITDLLGTHRIASFDGRRHIFCSMTDAQGRPQVWLTEISWPNQQNGPSN